MFFLTSADGNPSDRTTLYLAKESVTPSETPSRCSLLWRCLLSVLLSPLLPAYCPCCCLSVFFGWTLVLIADRCLLLAIRSYSPLAILLAGSSRPPGPGPACRPQDQGFGDYGGWRRQRYSGLGIQVSGLGLGIQVSDAFLSCPSRPHTHVAYPDLLSCPCPLYADWCLQSDLVPDLCLFIGPLVQMCLQAAEKAGCHVRVQTMTRA